MAKIYIAFIQEDEEAAKKIASFFRRQKHKINGSVATVGWERTALFIEQSDLFIYLISPAAIQNPIWKQQLDEAIRLKKDVQGIIVDKIESVFPDRGDRYTLDMSHHVSTRQLIKIHETLVQPQKTRQVHSDEPPRNQPWWIYVFTALIIVVIGALILTQFVLNDADNQTTPTPDTTVVNTVTAADIWVDLIDINPPIEIRPRGAAEWQVITDNTRVSSGARIRTNDFGEVTLAWANGDTIVVNPTSEIEIIRLSEGNTILQVEIMLFSGSLAHQVNEFGTEYTIRTSRLIFKPNSRRYAIQIEKDTTTLLQVYAGTVEVSNETNRATVSAGQELILFPDNRRFDVHSIGDVARITATPIPSATLTPSVTPENSPTPTLTATETETPTDTPTQTLTPPPTIFQPPVTIFPRTTTP